jgi:hypothetical protein
MKVVDEGIPYGVYIWQVNGKTIVDEDRNYLIAPARRGDLRAIARLKDFVNKELGIFEGQAVFEEGARPISDEEWEEQKERSLAGEVPDKYDLGNLIDEYKYRQEVDGL